MRNVLLFFLAFGWILYCPLELQGQEAPVLYKMYCKECHGANLEGGIASPLIKDSWLYGGSSRLMRKNIRRGIRGTEMRGWKRSLGKKKIRSIVAFIREAQTNSPTRKKPVQSIKSPGNGSGDKPKN